MNISDSSKRLHYAQQVKPTAQQFSSLFPEGAFSMSLTRAQAGPMRMQVSCLQALTAILLLSPALSLDHEDILIHCLSEGSLLVQLAAVQRLGRLAKAHPVHHGHTCEMLGQLAVKPGQHFACS